MTEKILSSQKVKHEPTGIRIKMNNNIIEGIRSRRQIHSTAHSASETEK